MAPSTYSFKDLTGSLVHPTQGAFPLQGQIGFGQITISMSTVRTIIEIAADGTAMISYIPGDNAMVSIEVQQTSIFNEFLEVGFNDLKTQADNGDVTNWAAITLTLRSLVDQSLHLGHGLAYTKIPDKVYTAQGQRRTWELIAGDMQNL